MFQPSPQHPHRQSIDQITAKVNRAIVDQEYNAIVHNRALRKNRNQMNLQTYIEHLQQANQKLHMQLDRQKSMHEKETELMKERLRAKDNLLEECEKEITKIRKQYQMIDRVVEKGKAQQENRKNSIPHGLLKTRKNK